MQAEFKDPLLLRRIFTLVKTRLTDVQLKFTRTHIFAQGMCSSHCSMISFNLDVAEVCSKYSFTYTEGDMMTISFSLESLLYVMKVANKDSVVSIALVDVTAVTKKDTMDVLNVHIASPDNQCSFGMRLMEIDCEELEIPVFDDDDFRNITLESSIVSKFVKDLADDTDVVTLMVRKQDPTYLSYTVNNAICNSAGKLTACLGTGNGGDFDMSIGVTYLKSYCIVPPGFSEFTTFMFRKEAPLMIKYHLCATVIKKDGMMKNNNSIMVLYIAPKAVDGMEDNE